MRIARAAAPALLMAALLAVYLVLVAVRAVAFLATGLPIGIAIGVALIVLPVIGAAALVRELLFGVRSQQLVSVLATEGPLPGALLPRRPSGRVVRSVADDAFGRYRDEVEAAPGDWRAWLRLGLAYDFSGDRRRARAAVRQAIALSRGGPAPA